MSKGAWWAFGVMAGALVAPVTALLTQLFLDRPMIYPHKEP